MRSTWLKNPQSRFPNGKREDKNGCSYQWKLLGCRNWLLPQTAVHNLGLLKAKHHCYGWLQCKYRLQSPGLWRDLGSKVSGKLIRMEWFNHKIPCDQGGYLSLTKTENQIDHVCIEKKFRRSLLDVCIGRGTDDALGHHLLVAHNNRKP